MFASFVLSALLSAPLFVQAIVTPLTPGPGDTFKVGGTCTTTWAGDTDANSPYKAMNIELMSGSNFDMVHITTLTPNTVDGTVAGKLDFTCPDVNPYSAIYFYQYSSAKGEKTWTTRFTITDPSGNSVPPANAIQPGSGDKIPWGVGALVNPSNAVAAPVGGGGADSSTSGSTSSSNSSSSALPSSSVVSSSSSFTTSVLAPAAVVTSTKSAVASGTQSATSTAKPTSGALGMVVDMRVWGVLAGVAAFISTL